MDLQTIINIVAGLVLSVMGWFARQLWEAVQRLQADLHKLEVDLPKHYLGKDEFTENMREVKSMLGKIFDRLEGKADK